MGLVRDALNYATGGLSGAIDSAGGTRKSKRADSGQGSADDGDKNSSDSGDKSLTGFLKYEGKRMGRRVMRNGNGRD